MEKILFQLQDLVKNKQSAINDWFSTKFTATEPFIYNSVDIRHSGFKITQVDTNIFPAGFNNLSEQAQDRATTEFKNCLSSDIQKVLIITEFHTRNLGYLNNVHILKTIIEKAGRQVELGSFHPEFNEKLELEDSQGNALTLHPLERKEDKIVIANDFVPDLIIVNNDLTSGSPEILKDISQKISPPTGMGWYRRTKYDHFQSYNTIANEFAKEFNIESFLISTELGFCKKVNFKERKGLECIAIEAEKTLSRIREKYQQYSIEREPYVYIKANRGTYGMGIMSIKDANEVFEINKKTRNKMNTIKSNTPNAEILIQEGIETIDTHNGAPCEPFIYIVNGNPVGTILRVNSAKDTQSNLNSTGAEFVSADDISEFNDKFPIYSIVAKLAALAAKSEEYNND